MPAARLFVLALALALAAAPLAAKPGAPLSPDETRLRAGSIAACTRRLVEVEGARAGEVMALCRCAADRLLAGSSEADLAALDRGVMPSRMGPAVLRCLSDVRPDNAGALAAAAMRPAAPAEPPAASTATATTATTPDKPVAEEEVVEEEASPSGPGLFDRLSTWLDGFSLSGMPRWAWALVALLGFLVLRRMFRRPERDDDLMGPPRPDHYRNLPRY